MDEATEILNADTIRIPDEETRPGDGSARPDGGDSLASLRGQVPSEGLTVMLDTTTLRDAVFTIQHKPTALGLLDLATVANAVTFFDTILVQPDYLTEVSDIAEPCGIQPLRYDRAAIVDELCTPAEIDPHAWDGYQHSPWYWNGIVATDYMFPMFGSSPLGPSTESSQDQRRFLGIQTARTMFNDGLAAKLGVPSMAASLRAPIQAYLIETRLRRQMIMDRVIEELTGPDTVGRSRAGLADRTDLASIYAQDYAAPFVLGLILERMKRPADFWPLLAEYRERFRPLRRHILETREDWDGRTARYTRELLAKIGQASGTVTDARSDVIDTVAATVSPIAGPGGPAVSLGVKVLASLVPAEQLRRYYHRWFRPELYLLSSLRSEAQHLHAFDTRIKKIWGGEWETSDAVLMQRLCDSNPLTSLRLIDLEL